MAQGLFGTNTPAAQLQQTRLQPAGTPGSTYVRPAQPADQGGNLRALSDALGSLNGALSNFGQVQDRINDNPDSIANQEWIAKRQQMTTDELRAEAEAGSPNGIRVRKDALDSLLGERANVDFRNQFTSFYHTEFDRANGDLKSTFDQQRAEFAEGLPSEIARGNFYRLTEGYYATMSASDTETKITNAKQNINTTIVDSWYSQVQDATASGSADVGAVAAGIMESSASNRTFYGLSQEEQIETLYGLASRLSLDGDHELAKALLDAPRKGPDGSTLPAISTIPAYAVKSARLVESAKGVRADLDNETSFPTRVAVNNSVTDGEFTEEDAAALPDTLYPPQTKAALVSQSNNNRARLLAQAQREAMERGRARVADQARFDTQSDAIVKMQQVGGAADIRDVTVPTASGGTTNYTREAQIEDVRVRLENEWADQEARMVAQGQDPVAARRAVDGMRLAWYESNGVHNEQWAGMFSTLPLAVNPDVLARNPEAIPKFIEHADLYRQIRAANPAYADSLLDPKSREFLGAYDMAIEFNRMSPEDAIGWAAGWSAQTDSERARRSIKPSDEDNIVRRVLREIGVDADSESDTMIRQRVQSLAALGGGNTRDIERRVTEWARDSTMVVNGVTMQTTRDMPQDFPVLADMELDRILAETPQGESVPRSAIYEKDDLFLRPVSGETKWQVWSKSMSGPIGAVFVTPESLKGQRDKIDAERSAMNREAIAETNEAMAQRRAEADAYIASERQRIERIRSRGGRSNLRAAEMHEERLERFIHYNGE